MTLATIPVDRVEVGRRLRDVSEKQVSALIASIGDVGLLNPITVYPRKVIDAGISVDGYGLVAGAHRLEAVRRLGHTEVAAQIVTMGDLERQIAECDENLCGSVLSPGERARFTARRKEAYEALHPEAKAHVAGAHASNRAQGNASANFAPASFADDQAAKTGQSKRTVQLDAERGTKVCKEALDILKGTKADTGTVLDAIKDLDPAAQVVAAYREVQKRQEPKIQAKAPPIAPDADSDEIALERQVDALMKAWNRASPDARREFLGRIDSPLMDKGGWE